MKKSEMTGEMFIQRRGFKGLDCWNDWHTYSDIRFKDDLTGSELASWDVMSVYKINKEGNYIKIWEREEVLTKEEFERQARVFMEALDENLYNKYIYNWHIEVNAVTKEVFFSYHTRPWRYVGVYEFPSEEKAEEFYNKFKKEIHKYWGESNLCR